MISSQRSLNTARSASSEGSEDLVFVEGEINAAPAGELREDPLFVRDARDEDVAAGRFGVAHARDDALERGAVGAHGVGHELPGEIGTAWIDRILRRHPHPRRFDGVA